MTMKVYRHYRRGRGDSVNRCARAGRLAVALLALGAAAPASAESLRDALVSAYLANPELKAQQAGLRATDEGVAQAKSGFRPRLMGEAGYAVQDVRTKTKGDLGALGGGAGGLGGLSDMFSQNGTSYPQSYSIKLSQPVFRGFRTINGVRGAEAAVEAGREDLRGVEQQILQSAVQAYMDVVRDMAIVKLQENNVNVLNEQLKANENRFRVGELTKTDVAQSKASLSGGQSELSVAQANLQISQANYQRIIGHPPSRLGSSSPIERLLPRSVAAALKIGEGEHPAILAALFRERAQSHAIEMARGELLPEVNVQASYDKTFDPQPGVKSMETAIVGGKISVPLYQAGEVGSRIRQSVEVRAQLRQQIDVARLQVRAQIASAWSQLASVKAQIVSNRAQVEANSVALTGVREEEKVGQRTILETLNAQLALLNSQVTLENTRRDEVVASYILLAAVGRLNVQGLSLPVATYDPSRHYNEVKDKPLDWDWSPSVEPSDEPAVGPVGRPAKGRRSGGGGGDGPAY